jgi:hypothetical protein
MTAMIINHGWRIYASPSTSVIHVMPVDDYRPHQFTPTCWCGAKPDDENVVTHHSLDRREYYEHIPVQ